MGLDYGGGRGLKMPKNDYIICERPLKVKDLLSYPITCRPTYLLEEDFFNQN